jgi:hypothetical protein
LTSTFIARAGMGAPTREMALSRNATRAGARIVTTSSDAPISSTVMYLRDSSSRRMPSFSRLTRG